MLICQNWFSSQTVTGFSSEFFAKWKHIFDNFDTAQFRRTSSSTEGCSECSSHETAWLHRHRKEVRSHVKPVSDRRNIFPSWLTTPFSKRASASLIEQQARAVAAGTEAFGSLQELATASDTIAKVLAARFCPLQPEMQLRFATKCLGVRWRCYTLSSALLPPCRPYALRYCQMSVLHVHLAPRFSKWKQKHTKKNPHQKSM